MSASFSNRFQQKIHRWRDDWRVLQLARNVTRHAKLDPNQPPVAFFNASTRLTGLSLNAAFSLLASSGLQLAGVPVTHFVCQSGLSRCVLGTNPDDHTAPPPCEACISQSKRLFLNAPGIGFGYVEDPDLAAHTASLGLDGLCKLEFEGVPLGSLVLPALRWALRRHNLLDDEPTRSLLRHYIHSAWHVSREFRAFLRQVEPAAAVIFNGLMYPEATARWVALQEGVPAITHEVGFQPFSAFFTTDQATAYPIDIPDSFELTEEQNARLDRYLEKRFQGQFTMAGIRFWPEISGLDESLLKKINQHRQVVPIFTNVIYDTSQVHANTLFPHMFAWLDVVREVIQAHPETLFVLRAHPDEKRPGTRKQSREAVSEWVVHNGLDRLPNVVFIDSGEYLSSYDLVQRAKFVMIYNSSIGLEAGLLGKVVLCGGQARFTRIPTMVFPESQEDFQQQAKDFLAVAEVVFPEDFRRNARRFLYYQLYRSSLPFGDFIEPHTRPGYVRLRSFHWRQLLPENSVTIQVLRDGILNGATFMLPDGPVGAIQSKP